jgi:hypothetical protein
LQKNFDGYPDVSTHRIFDTVHGIALKPPHPKIRGEEPPLDRDMLI